MRAKKKNPRRFYPDEDFVGVSFGRLTVVRQADVVSTPSGGKVRRMECACECGKRMTVRLPHLKNGHTQSCGCLKIETTRKNNTTHGLSRTPTYNSWLKLVERGTGKSDRKLYADRGIKVCKRWLKFENFLKDMGVKPKGRFSIDRINNDKGYFPSNCRWATDKQQARNTRGNLTVELYGKKIKLFELSEALGVDHNRVRNRIRLGWSVEKALHEKPNPNLKLLTYKGETLNQKQMAEKHGISMSIFSQRIGKLGWSLEKAIETPVAHMPKRRSTPFVPVCPNCQGELSRYLESRYGVCSKCHSNQRS
jgi:hypothetical protein